MKLLLTHSAVMCFRTKCKFCLKQPSSFYYAASQTSQLKTSFNFSKKNNSDLYFFVDPKDINHVSIFSNFAHSNLKSNPRSFRKIKRNNSKNINVSIVLTCKCGKSLWFLPNEKKITYSHKWLDLNIQYLLRKYVK